MREGRLRRTDETRKPFPRVVTRLRRTALTTDDDGRRRRDDPAPPPDNHVPPPPTTPGRVRRARAARARGAGRDVRLAARVAVRVRRDLRRDQHDARAARRADEALPAREGRAARVRRVDLRGRGHPRAGVRPPAACFVRWCCCTARACGVVWWWRRRNLAHVVVARGLTTLRGGADGARHCDANARRIGTDRSRFVADRCGATTVVYPAPTSLSPPHDHHRDACHPTAPPPARPPPPPFPSRCRTTR